MENEVDNIAQQLLQQYKSELLTHSASGNLLQNLAISIYSDEHHYEIRLDAPEYLRYLENGTKPHFPPLAKILEWVRIKPILPRPNTKGKLPSNQALAFAICKKMSQVGTKGVHIWDNLIKQNNYAERLSQAVAKELTKQFEDEHIQKIFKER